MMRGQAPACLALRDGGFMTQFLDRLPYFLVHTSEHQNKVKNAVGTDAMKALVSEKLNGEYEAKSLNDLHELHAFAFMLSESEQQTLKQKAEAYLKSTQGLILTTPVPAEKRRSTTKTGEKNKKPKTRTCDEEAQEAAKQLFK
eukprot:6456189-Amphidinium_carterae.1